MSALISFLPISLDLHTPSTSKLVTIPSEMPFNQTVDFVKSGGTISYDMSSQMNYTDISEAMFRRDLLLQSTSLLANLSNKSAPYGNSKSNIGEDR